MISENSLGGQPGQISIPNICCYEKFIDTLNQRNYKSSNISNSADFILFYYYYFLGLCQEMTYQVGGYEGRVV